MTDNICYVYWIRTPLMGDIFSEGYVGVTSDVKRRVNEHINDAKSDRKQKRKDFEKVLRRNEFIIDVILKSTRDYCVDLENKLRPKPYIGWNIAEGGFCRKQKFGKEYYSKRLDKWGTIREWAEYANKPFEVIRSGLRANEPYDIDELIGLKRRTKRKYKTGYLKEDELMALYYLENTAMTKTRIVRDFFNYKDDAEEFFTITRVPKWLLNYAEVPLSTTCVLRVKRQTTIHDLEEISKIYFWYFFENLSIAEIARKLGYNRHPIKTLIRDLEDADRK